MAKLLTLDQFQTSMNSFADKCDARFMKKGEGAVYTIKKQDTAESGFFATYQLFSVVEDGDDVATGAKINIPKDYLVTDVTQTPLTVTAADKAAGGIFENNDDFAEGDKYIRFTVNVKDADKVENTYMYINLKSLVDEYHGGNGIELDSDTNTFSVKIDTANANGLAVTANGLALALATPDTYSKGTKTADGTAGALSSADKYKLDSLVEATDAEVAAVIAAIWAD